MQPASMAMVSLSAGPDKLHQAVTMFNNESAQPKPDIGATVRPRAVTLTSIRHQNKSFESPARYLASPHEHLNPSAFQAYGGTTTAQEMAELIRLRVDQPISVLARWIASRQIISLQWQGDLHLPLFQFDLANMRTRSGVQASLSELVGLMDDEECAAWFVQPNDWMAGEAPAKVIASSPELVVVAARACRCAVTG